MQWRVITIALILCVRGSDAESLTQLRFSPDGRYVLAQDKSGIEILTVHPFAILFHIAALNAEDAEFTPDSRQVVFIRPEAKVDQFRITFTGSASYVEGWSIAEQKEIKRSLLPPVVCRVERLSPNGDALACLDIRRRLLFFDVGSRRLIFQKRHFMYSVTRNDLDDAGVANSHALASAQFDFSTDGRFVLARPDNAEGSSIVWDIREKRGVRLSGTLHELKNNGSLFVGADRVLVRNGPVSVAEYQQGFETVKVMSFPSGNLLSSCRIPIGPIARASDQNYILVEFGAQAAAVELSTGQLISRGTSHLDVCGRYYVASSDDDKVALYEIGKGLQAEISLHSK